MTQKTNETQTTSLTVTVPAPWTVHHFVDEGMDPMESGLLEVEEMLYAVKESVESATVRDYEENSLVFRTSHPEEVADAFASLVAEAPALYATLLRFVRDVESQHEGDVEDAYAMDPDDLDPDTFQGAVANMAEASDCPWVASIYLMATGVLNRLDSPYLGDGRGVGA